MKKIVCILFILILCFNTTGALASWIPISWICESCHTVNEGNFCGECGIARPLWECSGCSRNNVTKYCTNCGMPYTHSHGLELMEEGDYEAAISYFEQKTYGDYEFKIMEAAVLLTEGKLSQNKYEEAEHSLSTAFKAWGSIIEKNGTVSHPLYYRALRNRLAVYDYYAQDASKRHALAEEIEYSVKYISTLDFLPDEDLTQTKDKELEYFRYASRMHEAGIYSLAMEWYEKSGINATATIKNKVKNQYEMQQRLLNTFSFDKVIAVVDKDITTWLYTQPARKALYSGDYQDEQVAYLCLDVKNESTTEGQQLKVTLKIDDDVAKYYTFDNKTELKAEEKYRYSIDSPIKTAVYNCKWYVNDILVDYGQYTIADGTSSQYDLIKEQLNATPFIEQKIGASDENSSIALRQDVRISENCIDLATLKENASLIPKIELENTSSTNLEKQMVLIINDGANYAVWEQQTLDKKASKVFRYTSFDYEVDKYKFTWYINGIKVADQFFEVLDSSTTGTSEVD